MNFIIGSAVKIQCEIDSDQVDDTTLTLESLKDPDGTELANSDAMPFGSGDTANIGSVVWQSVSGTNPIGRYTYIIKAENISNESFEKGYFNLVART